MPLEIKKQALEIESLAGAQTAQALLRAEALVPGAGREAVEALMAEARLTIDRADVQNGRVVIDGAAWCQCVYRQGEEATLRALTAKATLSHVFEMDGIEAGLTCRVYGRVEHVEARYENGHMVFEVAALLRAQVLRLEQTEVITDVSGLTALECDHQQIRSVKLAAENVVSVPLREEVSLPAALDARMALMEWGGAQVESAVADLGGVRVKGRVNLETLISSGVPGRPAALVKYPLTFDQLVELPDWLTQDVEAEAELERLETRMDQGGEGEDAVLRIEAEVRLKLQAYRTDEADALADAYTTAGPGLRVERRALTYAARIERLRCAEPFRGALILPENAPPVGSVLAARVLPDLAEWRSENGRAVLQGVLEASVLYMPAGSDRLASVRGELPFSLECPGVLNEDSWLRLEAVSADASALMSDRIELRCDLLVNGETRVTGHAEVAERLEEIEETPRRPAIVVCWPGEEDTLWSIGKRYKLPIEAVAALNGGKQTLQPGKALVLNGAR